MNEMFLLKLGEIVLKGGNRFQFENRLKTNVARRMRPFGDFRVSIVQSTVYVEPENADCDLDGAWEACHAIFGVVSLCRCRPSVMAARTYSPPPCVSGESANASCSTAACPLNETGSRPVSPATRP